MQDPASNPTTEKNSTPPIVDTREVVKRHMEDPNHVITDEELKQITITTDHLDVSEHPLIKALDKR